MKVVIDREHLLASSGKNRKEAMNTENLTQKQMAVAVARDVLKHLSVTRVESCTYLSGPVVDLLADAAGEQLQNHANAVMAHCDVCALGSMFLSHVRLFGRLTVGEFLKGRTEDGCVSFERHDINKRLIEIFGQHQLDMIECAFEDCDISGELSQEDEDLACDATDNFGEDYRERLKFIMQNIIDHDGTFVP